MSGELEDDRYPNKRSVYSERTKQAGYLDIVGLVCACSYFLVLKPVKLIRDAEGKQRAVDRKSDQAVEAPTWRLPFYCHSWQEYENVHVLFWLAKDTSWNWEIGPLVVVFFVPTFFLACDFVWITLFQKHALIDHCHYLTQLIWICYTTTWAAGEFYVTPNNDEALDLLKWNHETRNTARWYASWVLICAFIPITVLHAVWIPATMLGWIHTDDSLYDEKRRFSTDEGSDEGGEDGTVDILQEPLLRKSNTTTMSPAPISSPMAVP
jgi:hypothetical protein